MLVVNSDFSLHANKKAPEIGGRISYFYSPIRGQRALVILLPAQRMNR